MKKLSILITVILFWANTTATAQVSINTDGANPNASSMLDVVSTDKGMLIPRMTTNQRNSISNPATGLLVFDNETQSFWFYNASTWEELNSGSASPQTSLQDTDGDTKIQVEESADEDKIRFDIAGSEKMIIDNAGNVGIGTTDPISKLHIENGSLLINGTSGATPITGGGTRMMWIPEKKAFRAGNVTDVHWDNTYIGEYSAAMGYNTMARSDCSFAMGCGTYASAHSSTAMGYHTDATAHSSTAMGHYTDASGESSTAMGEGTEASGQYSTAMGYNTNASGISCTAMGHKTVADGFYSTAMGYLTTASYYYSTAMGYETEAIGDFSTAMGRGTKATHASSTAMGEYTKASGQIATAMGCNTRASYDFSTAMGYYTEASGKISTAMGDCTTAKSFVETCIGRYNTDYNPLSATSWNSSDRLFVIGNGTGNNSRSDALVIMKNGNVGIGTAAPSEKLEILDGGLMLNNTADSKKWVIDYDEADDYFFIDEYGINRHLVIKNGGNVGIGTTSPSNMLSVNGRANFTDRVGIGTTSPSCPLEINGSGSLTESFGYLNSSGSTGTSNGPSDYSIKTSHRIMASEFNAVSDQRVKTNFKISNHSNDLQRINQLNVTHYNYIDTIAKGSEKRLGFIAQQVETVFPQAVNISSQFIPSIYKLSQEVVYDSLANTQNIAMSTAHNLQKGDLLRLYNADQMQERKVIEVVSSTEFKIKSINKNNSQIFVFGKKVDDFRAVDYDRIFVLGISAIQKLSMENEGLNNTVNNMKAEIKKLNNSQADINARLFDIENFYKIQNSIAKQK